jgi:hypothetical protein
MIDLSHASFIGPPRSDAKTLDKLPQNLREVLLAANGFIVFGGGLHVRGICDVPDWHSLNRAWTGENALSNLYSTVDPDDIPLGQDFLGDQFLLRSGLVIRLSGETGEIEQTGLDLELFLDSAQENPDRFLSLNLLRQFERDDGPLEPGKLLSVYPPLCCKEAAGGVSLRAISAIEQVGYLADFARQISSAVDGTRVRFNVVP